MADAGSLVEALLKIRQAMPTALAEQGRTGITASDAMANPQAPPSFYKGSLPAQTGYQTDLKGDPNSSVVPYRNPETVPNQVAAPVEAASMPTFLKNLLNNDAVRAMVEKEAQEQRARRLSN